MSFGLIPEFVGRLPVISAVHQLTREDLVEILTEPKNALVKQYQRFFGYDSIELVFTEDALWEISDHALERETGARGLRSIIELALLDVMFELPSRTDVTKCVITKETISKGLKPTLVTSAGATTTSSTSSPKSPPEPHAPLRHEACQPATRQSTRPRRWSGRPHASRLGATGALEFRRVHDAARAARHLRDGRVDALARVADRDGGARARRQRVRRGGARPASCSRSSSRT